MIKYYTEVDSSVFKQIEINEIMLYKKFLSEFNSKYSDLLLRKGLSYNLELRHWVDEFSKIKLCNKKYDGYTTMLELSILYDGKILEAPNDDAGYDFFQIITYIQYIPIRRRYSIFISENLDELWNDITDGFLDIMNGYYVII